MKKKRQLLSDQEIVAKIPSAIEVAIERADWDNPKLRSKLIDTHCFQTPDGLYVVATRDKLEDTVYIHFSFRPVPIWAGGFDLYCITLRAKEILQLAGFDPEKAIISIFCHTIHFRY